MADLSSQLTDIFKAGLDANPDLAKSLASAISNDLGTGGKQTKAEANYRTADGSESCDKCSHFDGSSSCDIVSGHISPSGVSDNYESASKSKSAASDAGSSASDASGPASSSSDNSPPRDSSLPSDSGSTGKNPSDGG